MSIEPQIPEEWSGAERWAWGEIRAGRIADFHERYGQALDPQKPDGWDDGQKDRRLSQAFLVTILTENSFCCATPFKGVRIIGACFTEEIDLEHARLKRQLWLMQCRFHCTLNLKDLHVDGWLALNGSWLSGAIDLSGTVLDSHVFLRQVKVVSKADLSAAKIGGHLDMSSSNFYGKFNMSAAEVCQSLVMRQEATFKEVDLAGAKIGGHLNMSSSSFDDTLDMNGTEVGKNLIMGNKASFKEVDLKSAKVKGHLDMSSSSFDGKLDLTAAKVKGHLVMSGSSFDGKLDMNGTEVGQSLLMREKASFKEVDLVGAKIGGHLDMSGSSFDGTLDMDGTEVGQSLLARSTTFPTDEEVMLPFARIGSNLDLSEATIGAIDLTATTITGELRLGSIRGHGPTKWLEPSRMILRNTIVGAFQDAVVIQDGEVKTDSWPAQLELEGFIYRRLGGFGAEGKAEITDRDPMWFIKDWLGRDNPFSPSPYEQLADMLYKLGYPSKANAILYEARKRSRLSLLERGEGKLRVLPRRIGLWLLQSTIGYGLGTGYFRVLWWFGGITLIGFLVLLLSIEKANWDLFRMAWASFDQVLPFVKLNEGHEKFILENCSNWAIAYFYVQELLGYVLGGFLGAGLAGLTQKS